MAERAVCAYTRNVFPGFFSEDDLDDLISDVVTLMWVNRGSYDERLGTVSTWVARIAKNRVLDAVKSEKRRRSLFSAAALVERVDEDGAPVGFVPVARDETDAQVIAHDTERVLRESVRSERETNLLNGLLAERKPAELAAAENVAPKVIYPAVCNLRKHLRSSIAE